MPKSNYDAIIIGAGAAGLWCAATAAARQRKVLILEHNSTAGNKILISGGGRCNFTNLFGSHENYICQNPHFVKSALAQFSAADIIAKLQQYQISFYEKQAGQLFCQNHAQELLDMLLQECRQQRVELIYNCKQISVSKTNNGFAVSSSNGTYSAAKLVVATGGISYPRIGATDFGYRLAQQFGLKIITPRPALVPLIYPPKLRQQLADLAGSSLHARASCNGKVFSDDLLFTHKGLSGPLILQLSSYWHPAANISINLLPDIDLLAFIKTQKQQHGTANISKKLSQYLPKKIMAALLKSYAEHLVLGNFADINTRDAQHLANIFNNWQFVPAGSAGFGKAEVTYGGVDTSDIDSKTMHCKSCAGLYFIGEVLDVTGHLGGHNFQWAWASAHACAQDL